MNNKVNNHLLMVFSGQTIRWDKKAFILYFNNIHFKYSMDGLDKKFNELYYGYSMIEKAIQLDRLDKYENDQFFTHTMLFMYQVSLFSIYKMNNITPTSVISVSCGELAALYCCGIVDLDTACELVYIRAKAMNDTLDLNGRMIGVFCSKSIYDDRFKYLYNSIQLSLYVSPNCIVLTGSNDEVDDLMKRLNENNIKFSPLNSGTRFHCSVQDNCKDDILALNIKSTTPTIPLLSTANLKYFDNVYQYDSNHLYLNIRNPCYLQQAYEMVFNQFINSNDQHKLLICEVSTHHLGSSSLIINDIKQHLNSKNNNSNNNKNNNNNNNKLNSIKIINHINNNINHIEELKKEIINK